MDKSIVQTYNVIPVIKSRVKKEEAILSRQPKLEGNYCLLLNFRNQHMEPCFGKSWPT